MAFNPTPMQQLAIDTDGGVLVAAAAGSGKTAVLVERVMRKLTDPQAPVSADSLLIVTFTNAAAAEMRSRIEKRIYEECLRQPDNVELMRQKHLISSADICTIDSFCISLVRENFEKCGISPDFKISDGSDLQDLKAQVMGELINEQLTLAAPEFKQLLDLTDCEYDEKPLIRLIEEIYDYSLQLPFPEEFIASLKAPYFEEFKSGHVWYTEAFSKANELLSYAEELSLRLNNCAVYVEKNSDKCISYAASAALMLEDLKKECSKGNFDAFSSLLATSNLPRVPSIGSGENEDLFKETKKQLSELLSELRNFFPPVSFIKEQSEHIKPAVKLLCELIISYGSRLLDECKKENCLTFAHTEQLAFSLLCEKTESGLELREDMRFAADKYTEVLVDEFQDVNDLQNMLFYALSAKESKLFSVGDVKQSIYGFRGSNPQNFLSKKNSYIPISKAQGCDKKKIILSDNFRSRSGVCEYINFFFSLFMGGQGSIVYNAEEQLNPAAKYPECSSPAAELLLCTPCEDSDDALLKSEAQCIAQYIKSTINEGKIIRDKSGELRKAEYSDFVILLNAMQGKASVISEELNAYNIPVAFSSEAYLETTEISVFTSLLQTIDNPRLDIPLLTVMMSPIFGFSAEDIALIRAEHKNDELYCAVTFAAQNGNAAAAKFLKRLSDMRRDAAMLPLERLIPKLLDSTDYLNIASAMPKGTLRRANLLKLISFASQYSALSKGSLTGFIRFLSSIPEKSFKGSGKENGVRIMSMHASKGLQFPICIVANLSGRINHADSISRILYTGGLGIGFKYYNEPTDSDFRTLGHLLSASRAKSATVDERLRLLYVAMTRAEDRLVLVSSNKDLSASLNRASIGITDKTPIISEHWLNSTISMNDWILSAALLHPDCDALRRLCDSKINTIEDKSSLKLSFYTAATPESEEIYNEDEGIAIDENLVLKAKENLAYAYPYEQLLPIQAKCSVSAIANKAESERFAFSERPSFMDKNTLTGAARGTAIHKIMQFIKMDSVPDIEEELLRLEDFRFITPLEAKSADRAALSKFFESDIFARILKSRDVRREMRFLTELPASLLDNSLPDNLKNTPIIVQGAVDLCFEETDGVVVLDFKTDRTDNDEQLTSAYGEQLQIYADAVEKIFGKRVKQKLIYSFALSKTIEII